MPELFTVIAAADAIALLQRHIAPLQRSETLSLDAALDRVLAVDLCAPSNLPAFPRSTMDGFALRAADTHGASEGLPAYFALVGEVPMGRAAVLTVHSGQAVRIHTGGMLPVDCNAVVMVEHTQLLDADTLEVLRPVAAGENVIQVGEDVRSGQTLFERGQRLRPQDLGALASVGITSIAVVARPRVALLATGDEVVPADHEPQPGQVRDVNSHTLAALVRRAGGEPVTHGIAPDDAATLQRMATTALVDADALVVSAGSSVSTRDLTAHVIAGLGQPGVLVHGVAVRPGKPTILAVADGKPVFGLPGNPVSTMITFALFAAPALRWLQGSIAPLRNTVQATLTHNIASVPGRADYVPVRLVQRDTLHAEPIFGASNLISILAHADGLIGVPLDKAGLYAGEVVTVDL